MLPVLRRIGIMRKAILVSDATFLIVDNKLYVIPSGNRASCLISLGLRTVSGEESI